MNEGIKMVQMPGTEGNRGKKTSEDIKIPRYSDISVSVKDLTIEELERRKDLVNRIRKSFKQELTHEEYLEASSLLSEAYFG